MEGHDREVKIVGGIVHLDLIPRLPSVGSAVDPFVSGDKECTVGCIAVHVERKEAFIRNGISPGIAFVA